MQILLYIENKLKITVTNNILHIKILGDYPNITELSKMFQTIQEFYNICKTNNKKFFHIFNFFNIEFSSIPSLLSDITKYTTFFNSHRDFFESNLIATIFIISNDFIKKALDSIILLFNPVKPTKFVTSFNEAYLYQNTIYKMLPLSEYNFA